MKAPGYFWTIYALVSAITLLVLCGSAKADGTPTFTVPVGGDCYLFTEYPTSENAARIVKEKGWKRLPLSRKLELSKRAEVILVQEEVICGPFLGELKVYNSWYYREKS